MTMDFEFSRTVDGPGLAASLGGEFRDGHLFVDGPDPVAISHAIESWLSERGLPLVPIQVSEFVFAFAPPAG